MPPMVVTESSRADKISAKCFQTSLRIILIGLCYTCVGNLYKTSLIINDEYSTVAKHEAYPHLHPQDVSQSEELERHINWNISNSDERGGNASRIEGSARDMNDVHNIISSNATNLLEKRNNKSGSESTTLGTKIIAFIPILLVMIVIFIPKLRLLPESNNTITSLSIAAQFCCSLILHLQFLTTLQTVDGGKLTILWAVAGSGLEGTFILSLTIMLLQKRQLWANGIVSILSNVSILFLYAMTTFIRKTGLPSIPSMFIFLSGIKETRTYIRGEVTNNMSEVIIGTIVAYMSALPAAILAWRESRGYVEDDKMICLHHRRAREGLMLRSSPSIRYLIILFMALVITYCLGAWVPVFHMYASICGSFVYNPPIDSIDQIETVQRRSEPREGAPNLILLIHESLSGELAMAREDAVDLMPFLQRKFQSNDDEFFVFENARTVSGHTERCIPAIVSGCLPLNEKGTKSALSTNMATQARTKGYETLSFSSYLLNMNGTRYSMVQNALSINFDQIWDPAVTREPLVNQAAQSDRLMGKNFKNWLHARSQGNDRTKKPFFAQFYYFDSHYPYFPGDSNASASNRFDGMLMTVDKGIEDIFGYLEDTGELNNTIVIGTGDHGEKNKRVLSWDANVLRPLTYMYVPKRLSARNPEMVSNLKHNRLQLVSILDLFPTMLHIIGNISSTELYDVARGDCLRGHDLLSQKIESDRVAWSFSRPLNKTTYNNFGVHYRGSSLVNHFGWPKDNWLRIFTYNQTIGSLGEDKEEDDLLTLVEWRSFLKGIVSSLERAVMSRDAVESHYMRQLFDDLDRNIDVE